MTTEETLNLAIRIEKTAASIYRLLYEKFKGDNFGEVLFYAMALDEDWHAAFIESEMKMLKTVPQAFGEPEVDSSTLEETLNKMKTIETFIRENPISIEKAVNTAIEIEEDVVEKRYVELMKIVSPSLKKIFGELVNMSINEHVGRLKVAAMRLRLKGE